MYKCTECGAAVRIPVVVTTVSCKRCGDTLFVNDGPVRRVYPALHMLPIDTKHTNGPEYPPSKWMLPWTRPVVNGWYDCRFRNTEPHVLRLWWNGRTFTTGKGEPVNCSFLLTWRGLLA